ncbi:MAG: hypothetical protein WBP13_10475 [Methylophilaceae bacterium]
MQKIFVVKSMQLSRYIQPNLNPAQKVDVDTVIVIPNIKFLKVPKIKLIAKSVKEIKNVKTTSQSTLEETVWQKAYDTLKAKNAYLKVEIEKLNVKLAHLLETFAKLQAEIKRLLVHGELLPTTGSASPVFGADASPISTSPASIGLGRGEQNSWYLLLPVLSVLFVMGLFFMFGLHKKTSTVKNHYSPSFNTKIKRNYVSIKNKWFAKNEPIKTKKSPVIFSADFPIEPVGKSEYTGSMIVTDLTDVGIPNDIDENALTLEQAQIYVDINREDVAIKLLKQQITAAPKAAIHHWLMLLDIYRNNNQKAEFLQYAKLLHEHFNVMMPSWDDVALPAAIATSLEQYEHIAKKITFLWENCEVETGKIALTKQYLDDLLLDNRRNERKGFSLEVFKEIMLLRGMLDMRQKLAFNH